MQETHLFKMDLHPQLFFVFSFIFNSFYWFSRIKWQKTEPLAIPWLEVNNKANTSNYPLSTYPLSPLSSIRSTQLRNTFWKKKTNGICIIPNTHVVSFSFECRRVRTSIRMTQTEINYPLLKKSGLELSFNVSLNRQHCDFLWH